MQGKRYTFSSTLMKCLREEATEEDCLQVEHALDSTIEGIHEAALSGLSPLEIGASSFISIDDMIDHSKKTTGGDLISCRAGCAHCCKQAVAITKPEAALLLAAVAVKNLTLDLDLLTRQTVYASDEQWAAQPEEARRCVFLGADNHCQVYAVRPIACRKYFSAGDPDSCDVEKNPSGNVHIWFSMSAEVLSTSLMTVYSADYLPRMLLKELRKEAVNGETQQHRDSQAL